MAKQSDPAKWHDFSNLTASYAAQVKRRRPTKEGAPTFDIVTDSKKGFIGDVKHVLLTGNEPFDRLVGGFPFGRITEVFGLENCGKTTMLVRAMCRFQNRMVHEVVSRDGFIYTLKPLDPKMVIPIWSYVDNEHSLEEGFKTTALNTIVDKDGKEVETRLTMDLVGLAMCDTIEQIFQNVDDFIKRIKEAEEICAEEGSKRTVFGLFIVDTIAGTSSREEMEGPWGKRDYPRQAQQISEAFRCLTNDIARHNVAMICTNQVRIKFKEVQRNAGHKVYFNTPQQEDFSTFGGRALACYATHRVFMFQMPNKYTLVKGGQFRAGYEVGFRTIKNRIRKPGREGRMVLLLDEVKGGMHNVLSLLESMLFLRVAKMSESGAISFLFKKFGIQTTTFADNIDLEGDDKDKAKAKAAPVRRRKKAEDADPEIDGRYQWFAFYRAHRSDLDKLWEAAMKRAYEIEGLDEHYDPPDEDGEGGEDADPELDTPANRSIHATLETTDIGDEDLT